MMDQQPHPSPAPPTKSLEASLSLARLALNRLKAAAAVAREREEGLAARVGSLASVVGSLQVTAQASRSTSATLAAEVERLREENKALVALPSAIVRLRKRLDLAESGEREARLGRERAESRAEELSAALAGAESALSRLTEVGTRQSREIERLGEELGKAGTANARLLAMIGSMRRR